RHGPGSPASGAVQPCGYGARCAVSRVYSAPAQALCSSGRGQRRILSPAAGRRSLQRFEGTDYAQQRLSRGMSRLECRSDYLLLESIETLGSLPLVAPRRGRRTALTFPVFPPPQKNWSEPSDSSPETLTPGG